MTRSAALARLLAVGLLTAACGLSGCIGLHWIATSAQPKGGHLCYPADGLPFVTDSRRKTSGEEIRKFCDGDYRIDREWDEPANTTRSTADVRDDDLAWHHVEFTCLSAVPASIPVESDPGKVAP